MIVMCPMCPSSKVQNNVMYLVQKAKQVPHSGQWSVGKQHSIVAGVSSDFHGVSGYANVSSSFNKLDMPPRARPAASLLSPEWHQFRSALAVWRPERASVAPVLVCSGSLRMEADRADS